VKSVRKMHSIPIQSSKSKLCELEEGSPEGTIEDYGRKDLRWSRWVIRKWKTEGW